MAWYTKQEGKATTDKRVEKKITQIIKQIIQAIKDHKNTFRKFKPLKSILTRFAFLQMSLLLLCIIHWCTVFLRKRVCFHNLLSTLLHIRNCFYFCWHNQSCIVTSFFIRPCDAISSTIKPWLIWFLWIPLVLLCSMYKTQFWAPSLTKEGAAASVSILMFLLTSLLGFLAHVNSESGTDHPIQKNTHP